MVDQGNLKVCAYAPLKPKRDDSAHCANGFSYKLARAPDKFLYGACCAPNLPGAVWDANIDGPACELGITPAQGVIGCAEDQEPLERGGLKVCR